MKREIVTIILFFFFQNCVHAQFAKQSAVWHLGYHEKIDFTNDPPLVTLGNSIDVVFEQPATICDENGGVLFYTDGVTIWNRFDEEMQNGDSITTERALAKTSSVIIPHPGDGQLYYVFVTNPWGEDISQGLHYSVVDMSGDGGRGAVIQKGVNLLNSVYTGLAVVADATDQSYWVIVHGRFDNSYHAYRVSETGIAPPVVSTIGRETIGNQMGQFQASPDGTKLVHSNGVSGIELFDFDSKTGELSNLKTIDESIASGPGFIGLEFSPNSEVLYCNDTYNLYQFDLSSGDINLINRSVKKIGGLGYISLRLELAYNGRIYASQGPGQVTDFMAEIERPNIIGRGCNLRKGLALNYVPLALPNSIQSYYRESPSLPSVKKCNTDSTRLSIHSIGYADSIAWDFGDGQKAVFPRLKGKSVLHQYSTPGTYNIKATKYIADISRELSSFVEIGLPPVIDLGKDTILCVGEQLILNAGDGFDYYAWSTGASTQIITIQDEMDLWAEVNNGYCSRFDTIVIKFNEFPVVELGWDIFSCAANPSLLQAEKDNRYRYEWSTGEMTSSILVNQSGIYSVLVSHDRCTSKDSVSVLYKNIHGIQLPSDTLVLDPGAGLQLDVGGVNVEQWQWYLGDGVFVIESHSQIEYYHTHKGQYDIGLVASNNYGCFEQFSFPVYVPEYTFIPNVITPNGDAKNDVFEVLYNGDEAVRLSIINRYGEEVYYNESYQNSWAAENHSQGVYFFRIQIGKEQYNGPLTVIK